VNTADVASSDVILDVSGLAHSFDGVRAVDSVSFGVARGSILGVIGPNGAGKSTVIDVISGMLRLQHGTVRFEGHDIGGWAPHRIANRGLIRTFQVSTGFARLTALENLLVVTQRDGLGGFATWLFKPGAIGAWEASATDDAMAALEEFGLAKQWRSYAEELSGGQKRLLELARAMMLHPTCLLLDEPTAGVSPVVIEELIERIKSLRERGITIVIVEHNLDVVERLCDDVVVLAEGRVLARGGMAQVRQIREVVDAYLG
jgi:ABC-type branched-subunit amino acid transport system ATPase component